jgi:hypothetical protein
MDTNQTSSGAPMATPEKSGGNGFWGIIVVIIILIAGGILLLNSEKNREETGADINIDISSEDEYAIPAITGTSDDTASIAADMEEMDFSDIDQGL